MKNLKTFESFSKLNENNGSKTTEEVIARYKQTPGLWNMAKNQYYYVITGDEYTMEELKEYYPDWTVDDFKKVYLAMEGELPQDAI